MSEFAHQSPKNDGGHGQTPELPPSPRPLPKQLAPGQAVPKGMDLFHYVIRCLDDGCDHDDICQQLVQFGYSPQQSTQVIADCVQWRQANQGAVANPNEPGSGGELNSQMILGGGLFLLGLAITVISFLVASVRGGGTYVISWGFLVVGVVWFLRGFLQFNKERLAKADSHSALRDHRTTRQ